MPKAANRAQNVQIPGAETTQTPEGTEETQGDGSDAGVAGTAEPAATLPPDLQALVQMEVARTLARANASKTEPQAPAVELPTQEEALAQANADPKRRAVLSKDGYVVTSKPIVQGRDENGFAKV